MSLSKFDVKEGDILVCRFRNGHYVFMRVMSFTKTHLPRVSEMEIATELIVDNITGSSITTFMCTDRPTGAMYVLRESERYTEFPKKALMLRGCFIERFDDNRQYTVRYC